MAYLIEFTMNARSRLLLQTCQDDLCGRFEPAALRPGQVIVPAYEFVGAVIDQIKPDVNVVARPVKAMSADKVTVEFGIVMGVKLSRSSLEAGRRCTSL